MPTPTKGPRLGGGPAHERLILANLATQLILHRRITTTETKAKRLRPLAERLITFAKRGDLHARRRVMRIVADKTAVHELFTQIAPAVAERQGGYTRITKIGPRKGDNAPMAVIELILEPVSARQGVVGEATRAAAAAAPVAPAPVTSAPAAPATMTPVEEVEEVVVEDVVEPETVAEPGDVVEADVVEPETVAEPGDVVEADMVEPEVEADAVDVDAQTPPEPDKA